VSATTASSRRQLAQAFLRDIRSPEWGVAGQLIRFALSGGTVAIVYVSITTALHTLAGLRFQLALLIGFLAGVGLHFTLQRVFVWRHNEDFALAAHHQALRYLALCASQYGLTALSTAQLPGLVGLPVEVVYLATMLTIAAFNFLFFRGRVFHPDAGRSQPDPEPKREAMS